MVGRRMMFGEIISLLVGGVFVPIDVELAGLGGCDHGSSRIACP